VFQYLRARLSEPTDAEGITVGVLIKAIQALPRYKKKRIPCAA
jgi:hypothetical protein